MHKFDEPCHQGAYQFTLGLTNDVFQQIFARRETRTTTTYTANLDDKTGISMIPVEIRPWWNTSNMVQVNNSRWKSMIGDALLDVSQTSLTLRSQHTINPQDWG